MTKQAEGAAERPARGRGRRPADEVRADVFRVVADVLLKEGIADLTFERVARLSGVSKTTLYKWWPSKGALALDGYFHAVEETLAFEDTGDIRADLTRQLRAFAHIMTGTPAGRVVTELIGQSQTDEDLATAFRSLYSSERRRLAGRGCCARRSRDRSVTTSTSRSSSTSCGAPSTTGCSSRTSR